MDGGARSQVVHSGGRRGAGGRAAARRGAPSSTRFRRGAPPASWKRAEERERQAPASECHQLAAAPGEDKGRVGERSSRPARAWCCRRRHARRRARQQAARRRARQQAARVRRHAARPRRCSPRLRAALLGSGRAGRRDGGWENVDGAARSQDVHLTIGGAPADARRSSPPATRFR